MRETLHQAAQPPRIVNLRAEEALVSALHKVAMESSPRVLFTMGHGELDPNCACRRAPLAAWAPQNVERDAQSDRHNDDAGLGPREPGEEREVDDHHPARALDESGYAL